MRIHLSLLPIVLGAASLIAVGDAVLMRRHPIEVAKTVGAAAIPDKIGLTAAREGDGLRVQWNRNAGMVRKATHGLLYIEDGRYQSQFSLSDQQLADSMVQYWPETANVRFRLELYNGTESVADEVKIAAERGTPLVHTARAVVERVRPSPFERTRPEVVRQEAPPPVVSAVVRRQPEPVVETAAEEPRRKGFLSRIPLLRRLKKHPQTTDPPPFDDTVNRR